MQKSDRNKSIKDAMKDDPSSLLSLIRCGLAPTLTNHSLEKDCRPSVSINEVTCLYDPTFQPKQLPYVHADSDFTFQLLATGTN